MALPGTILPSIATFANQKEKCWENVSILDYVFRDVCWLFYMLLVNLCNNKEIAFQSRCRINPYLLVKFGN